MIPNVDGGQEIRGQEREVQSAQSETCQQLDVIGGNAIVHLTRRPISEVTSSIIIQKVQVYLMKTSVCCV